MITMPFRRRKSQNPNKRTGAVYADLREKMVREQIEKRGITDANVLEAMQKVPRHLFTKSTYVREAYTDHALPIECGQTISQPYIVALMTELLQLEAELNVLEIGTGCGYQTAVLAELVTQVYSVEIIPELAENARTQLDSLGYQNITLKVGNGYNGWEEHAPYGRIIVTAAPKVLPNRLIEQLAEGGRMIIPIGNYDQELVLISKTERGVEQTKVIGVRFVPMTGAIDDK